MLAERDIEGTDESVRLWCNEFGPLFSKRLERKHAGFGDTIFVDEVFVTIKDPRFHRWRGVDQDGDVVDVDRPSRGDAKAAQIAPQKTLFESWNDAVAA